MTEQTANLTTSQDLESKRILAAAIEEKRRRVRDNGIRYYTPQTQQEPFHKSAKRLRAAFGSNRCLGGNTEIYDPVLNQSHKVSDIVGPFHVLAWDGSKLVVAEAEKPFTKGVDDIYEVTLSTGEKFECSKSHLLFDGDEFVPLGDMRQGLSLFHPRTSWVFSRLVRVSGAIHSSKTTEDSPNGCHPCHYSCDAQLRPYQDSDQDALPSQVCEEVHISYEDYGQMDDQGYTQACSHPYQLCDLPSILDVLHQTWDQFVGTLCNIFYKLFGLIHGHTPVPRLSTAGSSLEKSTPVFYQQDTRFCSTNPSNTSSSICTHSAIISIVYNRRDVKWDFSVPMYHNYWACGVIHHNSGKTVSGSCEAVWYATGTHPYKDIPTPNFGRIVCTDFTNGIEKVILPEVRKWLPKHMLKFYHKESRTMHLTNGSTIEFMSYDQDVEKFAGASRHWTWFDEEPPQRIYAECRMRLIDTKGDLWITMTPDKGMSWVYTDIYERAGIDPDIDIFHYGVYDNPYVDNDEIDMIKRGLSEGQIEAKIYGKFVQMSGLIYKEYDPTRHLLSPSFKIPAGCPRVCSIDPHPRISTAVLYMAIIPRDKFINEIRAQNIPLNVTIPETIKQVYVVYDEIFPHDPPLIKDVVKLMQNHEGSDYISYRLIDNSANTPDPIMGTTIRQELARLGMRTVLANKDVDNRIFKVRAALQENRLFFIDNLPETTWEIRHYSWDDFQIGKDYRDPKETPRKKRDHMMDNLGYMVVSSPTTVQPTVYRPDRKTVDKETGY